MQCALIEVLKINRDLRPHGANEWDFSGNALVGDGRYDRRSAIAVVRILGQDLVSGRIEVGLIQRSEHARRRPVPLRDHDPEARRGQPGHDQTHSFPPIT